MKITVETVVKADLSSVWSAWTNPEDIKQWNAASEDWHTPRATVDLREGGKFVARMEAKDGAEGFDFEGTYGRRVKVEFTEQAGAVLVRETFDAEKENPPEVQRQGWQAILDKFAQHVEEKS